jgi:hypothetical protein
MNFQQERAELRKFSYLLMNPVFVRLWHRARPAVVHQDKFLVMWRPTPQIIYSKMKKGRKEIFEKDSFLLQQRSPQLEENRHQAIQLLQHLYGSENVACVPFSKELEVSLVNSALEELDAPMRASQDVWDTLFDKELISI